LPFRLIKPMPPATKPGPTILNGRYRLVRPAGSGGTANVYLAEELSTGKKVAVKVLKRQLMSDPDMLARFSREADVLSQIQHPNIVRLESYQQSTEGLLLLLEWVEGQRLDEVLEEGPMPGAHVLRVFEQLAGALGAIHDQAVVHRDIKPENVMLVASRHGPVVRLLDFGIARFLSPHESLSGFVTHAGMAAGTPTYVAPEQIRGRPPTARTDVYAWGVVAFEAVSGRPPFDGPTEYQILESHVNEPPPPLVPLDASLEGSTLLPLICWALQKDPGDRPADGNELLRALQLPPAQARKKRWWKLHRG
jgi:serine/threonine protein kinase, bacterial